MTRRGVLAGAAVWGGTAAGLVAQGVAAPAASAAPGAAKAPPADAVTVAPGDPRYPSLIHRGCNARFVGRPDYVRVVSTTGQVVDAVRQAVREGRRIAVRSGGHCFENFVDDPAFWTPPDAARNACSTTTWRRSAGGSTRSPGPGPGEVPWLRAAGAVQGTAPARFKAKTAYLRKRFTDGQAEVAYERLSGTAGADLDGSLWLVSYGGRVNTVASDATAVAQRDAILKAIYTASWEAGQDDGPPLAWVRDFYRTVYADTGGVPAPGGANDASFVNYPDTDLADPALNTSGVPWHTLYYKDNYPRLQRIKARWDPRDEFRHALSVRPPR
ncbi:BBE domain-containing protein [Streptomyces triculaminicus]